MVLVTAATGMVVIVAMVVVLVLMAIALPLIVLIVVPLLLRLVVVLLRVREAHHVLVAAVGQRGAQLDKALGDLGGGTGIMGVRRQAGIATLEPHAQSEID